MVSQGKTGKPGMTLRQMLEKTIYELSPANGHTCRCDDCQNIEKACKAGLMLADVIGSNKEEVALYNLVKTIILRISS